ncbi:MAG: tetratricopeptide repeat protein, partial [Anaerolineales bacterium]
MPETSLRAYGRDIDELIERERLEEAIAHCRYILQTYPKHLETYRLLGKAYLEAKRYGDAADIFQRVLSAVPDDFVSHVGMAIVREDEGNLDAAIWHMERAFETNPSNPAIQQEMKRLISRRDGLEPHKVRLTRGALARMYAHGELFAQAIAELRSALQEDAERPDLQVLLASMYWQTDQRSDAKSVANQILEKLPYCAEANRILAANLQASNRVEEAAVYHRRLANLDPYAAFVESALSDSNSIEESAVSLEKLDWVAGEPLPSAAPGQPGWAATLGMEMQEPREEAPEEARPPQTGPLPSWLEPGEPPPFEATAEKELREGIETQSADGSGDEAGAGFLDQLDTDVSEPIEPEPEDDEEGLGGLEDAAAGVAAGVMAGGDEDDSEEAGMFDQSESDAPDESDSRQPEMEPTEVSGLGDEAAGIAAAIGVTDREFDFSDEEAIDEVIATGEEGLEGEATPMDEVQAEEVPIMGEEAAESEIPDWMQDAGWTESSGEFEDAPVSFSDQELQSLDAGQIPADVPADDDTELTPAELPDWIHDIAPEELDGSSDGVGEEGIPDWIPSDETEQLSDDEPALAEAGIEGEDSFPTADTDTSELPTWIADDAPGATSTIVTWLEDQGTDSVEEVADESGEIPDWMRETGPLEDSLEPDVVEIEPDSTPASEPSIEEPSGEITSSDEPASESWLSAVAAVAAEEESEPPGPASDGETVEPPDWLSETMDSPDDSAPGEAAAGIGLVAAGMSAEEEVESLDTEMDLSAEEIDLEHEAAVPIAAEDELQVEPVDTDVPSFADEVESFGDQAPAETVGEELPPEEPIQEADTAAGEPAVAVETTGPAEAGDAPDWLEEIGTLPKQPVETDSADWLEGLEVDGEVAPVESTAETPEWLKGLAVEGANGEDSGAGPAPDWLREIGEPGSVDQQDEAVEPGDGEPQEELTEEPVAEGAASAPDWLQGMASDDEVTDDVQEADLPEPELVEFQSETPQATTGEDDEVMDWLEDLAAKQAEAPTADEIEAAAQVEPAAPVLEQRDFPDEPEEGLEWLEQLADQRGIDVDVRVPGQAAPEAPKPEPEPSPESEPEPDTAPGWLGRMATQPIPKVDMEALEATARGEGISPDAETVEAQAADVQSPLDAQQAGPGDVAPDDITIEARASDLLAEIQAAEEAEVEPEDEIPDWLIAAAEETGAPEEAPSTLPTESTETVDEIEAEPALPEAPPDSPEFRIADTGQEDATVEEVAEIEEVSTAEQDVEAELADAHVEPEEPAAFEITEEPEPYEPSPVEPAEEPEAESV